MKPDQAAATRDFLVENLVQEAVTTKKVLSAVPEKGNSYKPDPKSRTALELAWHIASADEWFVDGILAGKFDMEGGGEMKMPASGLTPNDIVAHYDKNYVSKIARLKTLSGEKLATPTDFMGAFNFPMIVYILWLNNHTIHHRGQLCAYLRAMGSKVPSVYGGSADVPFQMPA